jgi:glutamate formiminotransferase / 5-formyltetrahydrofolate cyclo-ligase
LASACADVLLDLHRDASHHRAVFTLGGAAPDVEQGARSLTAGAVELLDLDRHAGVHPRFGVVDVVPFVALPAEIGRMRTVPEQSWHAIDLSLAVSARDRFVEWAASALSVPCFRFGPLPDGRSRSLPEVRRQAFTTLEPDAGPAQPHPRAGAIAAGARRPLVAYNLWLAGATPSRARQLAATLRGPSVRALAFEMTGAVQVSCNLIDPFAVGPLEVFDQLMNALRPPERIARAELVGLVPGAVLQRIPPERQAELALSPTATIERRVDESELRRR